MEFRILGPLEVVSDGRVLDLGGAKQRGLLAVLLLHANEVVSQARLIEALWEEEPPETAPKALQVYVSKLRKLIGADRIVTRAPGYLIRVEPGELDVERFQHLVEQGGAGKLREALALWRGEPLAEFAYDRFAQREIGRLEELRLTALEDRIEADLALGRHAAVVGELEALVAEHPLRERLRGQLMLALYRSGRQAEALEVYQAARRALVDELGIDPGRVLQELERSILLQDSSLDAPTRSVERARPEPSSGFVGRERELGELMGTLEDALAGRGRVVLIAGEPGIGKSRLADQLVEEARMRGAQVLVGRCWEAGGAPAYWPWVQALRGYVRAADPEALRAQLGTGAGDLAQLLPDLSDLFPEASASPSTEAEGARFRLFDATASFLRSIAEARPLVLVLDDVHAADAPSLLLLQFLTRELGESRILLAAAYRDVDPTIGDPLAAAVADLVSQRVTRRVALVGLTRPDVGRLVELTGGVTPAPELVAGIYEETAGNPLFVGEVVRLLAQEGLLGGGRVGVERIGVPQGVREVIGRRLRRLSEGCTQILTLASVLGREFGLMALQSVSALPLDELLKGLDEAMTARIVVEVPGSAGRLCFAHALIRDALYEDLTEVRRIGLHRLAGEALEGLYAANPDRHLAELAHHYFLAAPGGEAAKAVEYARRAADRAAASLAYEEAARLYRMACEALELGVGDKSTRCELLLALGEAENAAGEGAVSKETFLEAAEIARGLEAPEQLARAALGYGGRFAWGRPGGDRRLVPLLEEALAGLGEADSALRARLLARLACALRGDPSPERRDSLSREAVEIARASGDPGTLVYALMGRRLVAWAPENLDELLEIASEIASLADEAGEPERAADARLLKLEGHLIHGDAHGVHAELDAAARLAADTRRQSTHWHVEVHRGELALLEGRFADAERHIAEMVRLGEQAQVSNVASFASAQTFALRWLVGGLEETLGALERLVEERPTLAFFRCLLAVVDLELGHEERARRALRALGADDFAAVPRDEDWMLALALLIEVAASVGDVESAAVLYRLLEPHGDLVVVSPHQFGTGSAARSLGVAATAIGRFDRAERHFEDALALNAAIGARPWLARTQCDYARMLLARAEPGDREKAQELLAAALGTYRELGMDSYAARASALVREAAVSTA